MRKVTYVAGNMRTDVLKDIEGKIYKIELIPIVKDDYKYNPKRVAKIRELAKVK